MGLLKVAEQLINPFGDDDEDFELNWIIDRHMKVSFLGVDVLNSNPPPLVRDNYYYQLDMKLPYTEAALGYKKKTYRGSVAKMQEAESARSGIRRGGRRRQNSSHLRNGQSGCISLDPGWRQTEYSIQCFESNLDTVTLESGSNNWKVSNPSLFIPDADLMSDNKPTTGSVYGIHVPEESSEVGSPQPAAQPQKPQHRKSSDHTTGALKKAVKKIPIKRPHLRRRGHNQPQNRWVAFHSTPNRDEDHEVLSLYKSEKPAETHLQTTLTNRRQSFDERSLAALQAKSSSRFQSLPDVKKLASDEWEDMAVEDQDNISTANLLVVHEDQDEDGIVMDRPPMLTFTRASLSPCPSSGDSEDYFGHLGLQPATSLTSVNEFHDEEPENKK
ncbi:bestrophin homolog [Caerostris darwini]|uniref:Bestrophin homolog n=1 Tax=Caerostris darwini TaxID=1538125 RepID=A0AAV4UEF5_9ARAC|nr:bestrophin homolog [Caerostris darwini]